MEQALGFLELQTKVVKSDIFKAHHKWLLQTKGLSFLEVPWVWTVIGLAAWCGVRRCPDVLFPWYIFSNQGIRARRRAGEHQPVVPSLNRSPGAARSASHQCTYTYVWGSPCDVIQVSSLTLGFQLIDFCILHMDNDYFLFILLGFFRGWVGDIWTDNS